MKTDRREFLKKSLGTSLVLASSGFSSTIFRDDDNLTKITILHTNDVHSRIDPFPMDGSRNEGLGGAVRRAKLIEDIRSKNEHVLLLDAGDIFQGTPYFNFYGGELEMKLMSEMAYDCATMGNHDFDAGVEGFYKQLPHANFPFVVSNYEMKDTIIGSQVKKYLTFQKGDIKIGVVGVGIELKDLVPDKLYKNVIYQDPIHHADRYAKYLKKELDCDYVICLSHLGYKYSDNTVSDIHLAQNTEHIDLILGGHTHTFMYKPDIRRNLKGKEVVINQAGWAGILLGQIEVFFEKNKRGKCVSCKNSLIG